MGGGGVVLGLPVGGRCGARERRGGRVVGRAGVGRGGAGRSGVSAATMPDWREDAERSLRLSLF